MFRAEVLSNIAFDFFWNFQIHIAGKVRMTECRLSANSFQRVLLEHPWQKIKCFWWNFRVYFFVETEITSPILIENLVILFTLKDWNSKQKMMENNTSGKDVAYRLTLCTHIPNINDLGSYKARSATTDEQILFLISICR